MGTGVFFITFDTLQDDSDDRKEYLLTVRRSYWNPDSYWNDIITLDGEQTGPTITVDEGETLSLSFFNKLGTEPLGIHLHGIRLRGQSSSSVGDDNPWDDGTVGISQPGTSPYSAVRYDVKIKGQYGSYWYHSSLPGQLQDGLYGALVVHSRRDPYRDYPDKTIVLQDYRQVPARGWLAAYDSVMGSGANSTNNNTAKTLPAITTILFNGRGNAFSEECNSGHLETFYEPLLYCSSRHLDRKDVDKGETYRLRIIAAFNEPSVCFTIEDHEMQVIGIDGTPVKKLTTTALEITAGSRVDVLVKATGDLDRNYWMTATTTDPAYQNVTVLGHGRLHYKDASKADLPTTPRPTKCPPDGEDYLDHIDIFEQIEPYEENKPCSNPSQVFLNVSFEADTLTWYLNGKSFELPAIPHIWSWLNEYTIEAPDEDLIFEFDLNTCVEVVINNDPSLAIDQPIHLHGFSFWVMLTGYGQIGESEVQNVERDNALMRDTVTIPAGGHLVLRFLADTVGPWLLQSQISQNFAHGFGALFQIGSHKQLLTSYEQKQKFIENWRDDVYKF